MVDYVRVYCDYDYNWGAAYFDDIQLVRNCLECGLTESDFYVEDTSEEENTEEDTTESDAFEEAKDAFGNVLTETIFNEAETAAIYRSFGYNTASAGTANAGNHLIYETDARGNKTQYVVDEETSRNMEVIDRCGNRTAYEYDSEGKVTKVTSKDTNNTEIAHVSYGYDSLGNMTEIVRGDGMKYVLAYNAFHNLESISIDGKPERLVAYTYKNGNGRLKQVTYANGDTMKVTYNSIGQMNSEKWYNALGELTAYYKYVYDGSGNVVRTIDLFGEKEYDYVYENGQIVRATEYDVVVSASGLVISKNTVNNIYYRYDSQNVLSQKKIVAADGTEQIVSYISSNENNQTTQITMGSKVITSSTTTDEFGRKTEERIGCGESYIMHTYGYCAGKITDEHTAHNKIKGSATTELPNAVMISNGRTLSYMYDEEERITQYNDKHTGWRDYVYDAQGQLTKEYWKSELINEMTYDKYGNILSKNGITYTYGDPVWKDRLTSYGNQAISYDTQGNPTTYLGHTLTWEKGRQLKSFDNIQYTYNANGIRTSKTVNGVKHTYTLDGTKVLRETWGDHVLIPLYDTAGEVIGIDYDNECYYFQKNLQGDVIGITGANAAVCVEYTYDAWGVCTITTDWSECGLAEINPYRYRGYYYDVETGFYYVSSRYYDPEVVRFISPDDVDYLGFSGTVLSYNMYAYCENNPVNMIDADGHAAIHFAFAAIGGLAGWKLGDYVAKKLGYRSGKKYWAIRAGVTIGSAVIGWFSARLMTQILTGYLRSNPSLIFKMSSKWGVSKFNSVVSFLGINPFNLSMNSSKFIGIARLYNSKSVTLGYSWAVSLYNKAKSLGFKVMLDKPHGGYGWHIHLSGSNGKLSNLHIQISKAAWKYLSGRIK